MHRLSPMTMAATLSLRRRDLLRLGAGTAAGLAVNACSPGPDPYSAAKPPVPGSERWRRFQEASVASSCGQCPAACGIRVRVVEGRAVRIDGALDNPINRGGIGPRGLASLQVLYDPDRIRQPLHRVGGRLEPISWEQALAVLGERLGNLRHDRTPERLAILCGRDRGMVRDLFERFALAFGTPNFADDRLRKGGAARLANHLMLGIDELPAYDWSRTRFVLSFGSGLLDSSCQSVYLARHTADLHRGSGRRRARIVHLEPSYSRTAANADEWISIPPGATAAVALALAHVLVRDQLYDADFVRQHCSGFGDWRDDHGQNHRGLESILKSDYAPEDVAASVGMKTATIERLATDLARNQPGFAILGGAALQGTDGLQAAMAVTTLNALLGSIQRVGGMLRHQRAPLADWPAFEADEIARRGLAAAPALHRSLLGMTSGASLVEAVEKSGEAAVDTLLLHYANPCHAWPAPKRWRAALEKIPFVVTFSPFLDETAAAVADLVLPDHTFLERWEDGEPTPSDGIPTLAIRQPVVEPLYDTRSSADVLLDLARALGEPMATAMPWPEFRDAMDQRLAGIHQAKRGNIQKDSAKAFQTQLFKQGFWTDDADVVPASQPEFGTPSGKLELAPSLLRAALEAAAVDSARSQASLLSELGYPDDLDRATLPHQPPLAAAADDAQVVIEAYDPGTYAEGSGANLPLLQELPTEPGVRPWTTATAIAAETAQALGINNGDTVELENELGKLRFVVRVQRGTRPGTLRIARGGGHEAFGRFAAGFGVNVMALLPLVVDRVTGIPIVQGHSARVRRVKT